MTDTPDASESPDAPDASESPDAPDAPRPAAEPLLPADQAPAHLRRVNPPELSPPTGFSHAVTAAAGSRLVFLAGQTALDAEGKVQAPGDLAVQFGIALGNLLAALRASGGTPADLVRVTVYTTDVAAYRAAARDLGRVWRDLAGREYPAMAVIGTTRLWDEQALVELDGLAVLP